MWFLFVLVPTATSALGALFSLTGGMNFAVVAAATEGWQRRKGYRSGEGHFTERANNSYYGVKFDVHAQGLNQKLGNLALITPGLLGRFENKRFDLTRSEGEFLSSLLTSTVGAVADLRAARELVEEQGGQEAIELLLTMTDRLAAVVIPVVHWLEQFPSARVKEV